MVNRALLSLIIVGSLGLVGSPPAQAQDPSPEPVWEASIRYEYDDLSNGRAAWQRATAILQRDIPRGSVGAVLIRQRRFAVVDVGTAVDLWRELWTDAYGHLRVGVGPNASIRPQRHVKAEGYQSLGSWEVLGHYEWRRYSSDDVHLFGPGFARYVGAWYLRTRTTIAPRPSTWAVSQRVGVRRYYYWTPTTSYVDLEAGVGRSVEFVGPNTNLLVARTSFASLRVRHFLTSNLGLTAAVRYSDDGPFTRTGGTVGLFAQW